MYPLGIQKGAIQINYIILKFQSITYANKAKRRLSAIGITSEIIKITEETAGEGCIFALRINYDDYFKAALELKNSDINFDAYNKLN